MTFFGRFGLGARTALLKKGAQFGAVLSRRNYMITLEVPCHDKNYQRLLQWITDKDAKTKHDFIPSTGTHFFRYNDKWLKEERTREQPTLYLHMDVPWKTVQALTAFGKDQEAGQIALKKHEEDEEDEQETITYYAVESEWESWNSWKFDRKRRPLESVVLDNGISERIVNDCREFINNPSWYSERGISPYRRGYLLHGPTGCGKTSYITALAGELERDICVLNLSEKDMTDDRLNYLIAVAPQQTIILLEDIDAVFTSREDSKEVKAAYDDLNKVTLSGLLRCLDCVTSREARILFMTANYLDRLDPELFGTGRADVIEYIGLCSASQAEQMFLRFYKESSSEKDLDELAKEFADSVMSFKKDVSPAQSQKYFMFYKSNPDAAVKNVAQIWEPRDE